MSHRLNRLLTLDSFSCIVDMYSRKVGLELEAPNGAHLWHLEAPDVWRAQRARKVASGGIVAALVPGARTTKNPALRRGWGLGGGLQSGDFEDLVALGQVDGGDGDVACAHGVPWR